ncbi:DUF2255 family protein [Isoptericola sp. NPDC019693]|uniref:DUF2255 family protein n=1 Tax=Isoptericola sp. NPDC019693 TaxID=3364009 RepID=UPI0037ACCC4A
MSAWSPAALATLQDGSSLHLSAGPGPLEVELGMVVADGELYLRAQRGAASQWYRAAIDHGVGRVRVDGQTFEVRLEAAGRRALPAVDAAYRHKYGALAAFASGATARAATLRVLPRAG